MMKKGPCEKRKKQTNKTQNIKTVVVVFFFKENTKIKPQQI